MARLPEIKRDDLPVEQQKFYDGIAQTRGTVHGPFSMLLHSPDVASWLDGLSIERRAVEEVWAAHLAYEAFRILRMQHTEDANKGCYINHFEPGAYECAGCGRLLYASSDKFATECGWPSFADCMPSALERIPHKPKVDEIRCATCGGHSAHP